MLHGDAVDIARKAQRNIGHVQHAVVATAKFFECLGAFFAENLARLIEGEPVVASGNRSVGGEDAFGANRVQVILSRIQQIAIGNLLF